MATPKPGLVTYLCARIAVCVERRRVSEPITGDIDPIEELAGIITRVDWLEQERAILVVELCGILLPCVESDWNKPIRAALMHLSEHTPVQT